MKTMLLIICLCLAIFSQAGGAASPAPQWQASEKVAVQKTASNAATSAGKRLRPDQMLAVLPRRIASKSGRPGDMVNLLLIGSEEQVTADFAAAGWIQPDKNAQDAIVHAIEQTMQHTAYSAMPISQLYLFGRSQDLSFVEGMPIQIAAERNHFRLWRAPWLDSDGRTVWVGAATHDTGIEKDTGGQLTHRIDPNVDAERDYVLGTLRDAGKTAKSEYLSPQDPVRQATTATGDSYHSDGRVLLMVLK